MTTPTKPTKNTTTDKVHAALAAHPDRTAAELADLTGLGRSTITKQLAALGRDGRATRIPGQHTDGRRQPDRWTTTADNPTARLRPGQLNDLVLTYMTNNPDSAPHGPVAIARALGRSSGAVANCLARLTTAGQLRQTGSNPRRYVLRGQRVR
jgi:DNA-binding IclR family transcriptional regulator